MENYHEIIYYGTWKGYPHARLTSNLRIIYHVNTEKKILTFERIVKHDEIDRS